ncbi:precorrin-3B synthase [Lichenifustis flavocetrariae]|uniref:Precorrin-3B synthase n=1 Tax=Lichenifustis flavocetrariae TaxID=2949735 RepID=A0AA41Z7F6_9HYPH|nr:precorrin-3B synthase [Lichenifustis flavocetrariae]MCW6510647.1 precorrin-3B synthase [Lichenifustis flavocetrariae]
MPAQFDARHPGRYACDARVTGASSLRVGWCPGALRPMESGDGLLLRVKPRGGVLTLAQAEALAHLSLRYGNGHLDLTGRANLHLRGATADTLDALVEGFGKLGLLDASPDAEAVRNIVASPLAGLDPTCVDVTPMIAALETRLAQDAALHRLPPKWSFVLDGGGRFPLHGVAADVRFVFDRDGGLRVGLTGGSVCAWGSRDRIVDIAAALAGLVLAQDIPTRMRPLVDAQGAAAIFATVGLPLAGRASGPQIAVQPADILGPHMDAVPLFGIAPAFASLHADDLLRIVDIASRAGASDLRLTPWRVLLITGLVDPASFDGTSLIANPADPRLSIVTCAGAPACHRGSTATRVDAAALARRLGGATAVHVAGCSKGCAHPAPAPWTLVGQGGHYDLICDGSVKDMPVARGLSFNEAATWISRNVDTRGS